MTAGTIGLLLVAVVALGLALRSPLTTAAVALMVFGLLHNVLELRYVGGRFSSLLAGPVLRLLLTLITGIVLVRLVGAVFGLGAAVPAEILLTYTILGAAGWIGLRHTRWPLVAVVLLLGVGAFTSLRYPAYHVVVITHLHNLIPLAFLWDFAGKFSPARRRAFVAAQLIWLVVLPALIFAGVFDSLMSGTASTARLFNVSSSVITVGVLPPGSAGTTAGVRFLTVFAFLQLMHFVVWVFFLPRFAPATTAAFERRVPWLRGWRTWALGLGVGGGLLLLFVVDYGQGRTVYSALATYHAYLELPVLVAMLVGLGGARRFGGRSAEPREVVPADQLREPQRGFRSGG